MKNCRPAGMSSDEDSSDDDFGFSEPRAKRKNYQKNFLEEPSASSEETLFNAIINKDLAKVKQLLSTGVKLDVLQAGWSPLMFSCFHSSPDIVKVLLEKGSDIHFHKEFFTPLMAVCTNAVSGTQAQKKECIEILLANGLDVNAVDRFRTSTLMFAAREGLHEVVELLIDKHCDMNRQDKDGWSALFHAVYYNRLKVIDVLVARGVNLKFKDLNGQTAHELALSKEFHDAAAKVKFDFIVDEPTLFNVPPVLTIKQMLNEMPSRNTGNNPGFPSDIYNMLQGMNVQIYAEHFYKNGVQLGEFLVMKEDELKENGVRFFAHRQKMLSNLKRFHMYRWQRSSIGLKAKSEAIELIDGVKLLANTVKQLYVLQSTIHYVLLNKEDTSNTDVLKKVIKDVLNVSNLMEEELLRLHKFGRHIDRVKKVQAVDLIENEEKKETRVKLVKITMACAFGAVIFWKLKSCFQTSLKM